MSEKCEHWHADCNCDIILDCELCIECVYWIGFQAGEKKGREEEVIKQRKIREDIIRIDDLATEHARSQAFDEAIEIIEIWELDGISKCPDHGKNACLFCVLEQIEKKLKEKRGMK